MYNDSKLALEAKALLKRHLKINDGAAQGHVDLLSDGDLADIVAADDYPLSDRSEVIRGVLTRALPTTTPQWTPAWTEADEVAYAAGALARAGDDSLVVPPDPAPPADVAEEGDQAATPVDASPPTEDDDLDETVVVD